MKDETILLIADDNPGHSELLKINLKRYGLANQVLQFFDGNSVLEYIFSHKEQLSFAGGVPCILLLDIRMPGIDGPEVLRQLKSDEVLRELPVFIVTTTSDPRELEYCVRQGCIGYFIKPVDYALLAEQIKKLSTLTC